MSARHPTMHRFTTSFLGSHDVATVRFVEFDAASAANGGTSSNRSSGRTTPMCESRALLALAPLTITSTAGAEGVGELLPTL